MLIVFNAWYIYFGKSCPEMGGIFDSYSRLSIDILKRASFGILRKFISS